jgi:hypothetical protein
MLEAWQQQNSFLGSQDSGLTCTGVGALLSFSLPMVHHHVSGLLVHDHRGAVLLLKTANVYVLSDTFVNMKDLLYFLISSSSTTALWMILKLPTCSFTHLVHGPIEEVHYCICVTRSGFRTLQFFSYLVPPCFSSWHTVSPLFFLPSKVGPRAERPPVYSRKSSLLAGLVLPSCPVPMLIGCIDSTSCLKSAVVN